jgi:hypothetical protein
MIESYNIIDRLAIQAWDINYIFVDLLKGYTLSKFAGYFLLIVKGVPHFQFRNLLHL